MFVVVVIVILILTAAALYWAALMWGRPEPTTMGAGSTITHEVFTALEPYRGLQLSGEALAELEKEIDDEFCAALSDRGLLRGSWRARLRSDQIAGPECLVTDGTLEMSLSEFERAIVDGKVVLESV
jgi:hypothetical protein